MKNQYIVVEKEWTDEGTWFNGRELGVYCSLAQAEKYAERHAGSCAIIEARWSDGEYLHYDLDRRAS